jgi:hypothetical protein
MRAILFESYTNPETGKGWTDEEEAAFAGIQSVSRLTRIAAIQLWKRFKKDSGKALENAKGCYPPIPAAVLANLSRARHARTDAHAIDRIGSGRTISAPAVA